MYMYMPIPESEGLTYLITGILRDGIFQFATVIDHQADGQARMLFPNGRSEQLLCLMSKRWHLYQITP